MDTQSSESSIGGALRFLWRKMSPVRRRHFIAALAVMFVGLIAELLTIGAVLPFLAIIASPKDTSGLTVLRDVADGLGQSGQFGLVIAAALFLIAAAAIGALVRVWLTWTSLRFVLVLSQEIGQQVFSRMLRQPYGYYVTRNTSEILAGIDKVQTVVWSVLMPGMQGVAATLMSLGIAALLFAIDPQTAAIASGSMAAAYVGMALVVRSRLHRNSDRLAVAATQRVQTIQEGLGGIRDILLEQSQEVFEDRFAKVDSAYRRAQAVNNFILLSPRYVVEGAGIVVIAVLAVHLSRQPGGMMAAIPVLGALALGAQRVLPLLQQAYTGWSSLAGNRRVLFDVIELMSAPVVSSTPRDRSQPVMPFTASLALHDVGFRYVEREHALRSLNLTILKGQRVGFVGETGSGKSTLLDLVMGLLQPTSGAILIDGRPLADQNRAAWQAQIAHVPQAIFLADASIAANIAFGEHAATIDQAQVERSAKIAQLHDFIVGLPAGYGTQVGERGVRLSGGQRQRIGIARALYKRAPVLIFDEATSALDDATEHAIMSEIAALGNEVTMLMIAHRTTTLADCDVVIRLVAGEIVERGSYADVVVGTRRTSTTAAE